MFMYVYIYIYIEREMCLKYTHEKKPVKKGYMMIFTMAVWGSLCPKGQPLCVTRCTPESEHTGNLSKKHK